MNRQLARRRALAVCLGLATYLLAGGSALATDTQTVSADPATANPGAGQTMQLGIDYTTSTGDATLTGLGLRIHFDSGRLLFQGVSDVLATGLIARQDPVADGSDFDGDPTTDRFVLVAWADITANWPGTVPTRLLRITFQTAPNFSGQTTVRFSASSRAAGYTFTSTPAILLSSVLPTATETPAPATRTLTPTATATGQPATPTRTPTATATNPPPSATATAAVTTTARPSDTPIFPTATPTATSPPSGCTGDCSGDGSVTVDELVIGVTIALGLAGIEQCGSFDGDATGTVTVDELVTAVGNALAGCPEPGHTATPTSSPYPTSTHTTTPSPTPPASPSPTRTYTATASATATRTITPTVTAIPGGPVLRVGSASGRPGDAATFVVTLSTNEHVVPATQNDIAFDPLQIPVVARPNGAPDCTVNTTLGAELLLAFQPPGCNGSACTAVRAALYSLDVPLAIPDGAELYRCTVRITANAPAATYPLVVSGVVISDSEGLAIPGATGTDGAIVVLPAPGGTPTVRPTPTPPF